MVIWHKQEMLAAIKVASKGYFKIFGEFFSVKQEQMRNKNEMQNRTVKNSTI